MPDPNLENPEVRAEMIDIAKRWLARGVDGVRLDASRHIIEAGEEAKVSGSPETHAWWRKLARRLRREHSDVLLICENWTTVDEIAPCFDEQPFTRLDMNFNFDLAGAIAGVFPTDHDMVRVATQLRTPEKARFAASLLFTLPGVPFVYYGEEPGLVNRPGDEDPETRTPMPWADPGGFTTGTPWKVNRKAYPQVNVERRRADPGALWNHCRELIALRRSSMAVRVGGCRPLAVEGAAGGVIAWERFHWGERVVAIANFAGTVATGLLVAADARGQPDLETLVGDVDARVGEDGMLKVASLPARALVAFRLPSS